MRTTQKSLSYWGGLAFSVLFFVVVLAIGLWFLSRIGEVHGGQVPGLEPPKIGESGWDAYERQRQEQERQRLERELEHERQRRRAFEERERERERSRNNPFRIR